MLPKNLQVDRIANAFRYALVWLFIFHTVPAFAQQNATVYVPNAADMLANIAAQIPQLTSMVTAISYVTGMYFIIMGVIKLKHFGESRTMMSAEHSIRGPIVYLTVGVLLIYIPTSVQVGMSTFWTNPNPYGYTQEVSQWNEFINVCFVIIQFIGAVSFIRGLVLLSHMGNQSSQGAFGKGITHIIGGIFCINIYQFVQVIFSTLGIQVSL